MCELQSEHQNCTYVGIFCSIHVLTPYVLYSTSSTEASCACVRTVYCYDHGSTIYEYILEKKTKAT